MDTRIHGRDLSGRVIIDNGLTKNQNRTILGYDQEAWVHERLSESTKNGKQWRILGNQVLFAPFLPLLNIPILTDSWDGYPYARDRLLRHIKDNNIDNTVFVTGDIHSSWVFDLPFGGKYDKRTGNGSIAVEFVTPSVTSPSAELFSGILQSVLLLRLPALRYTNLPDHGYMVLEVTPSQITTQYHYMKTVKSVSEETFLGPRFVVKAGENKISRT